MVANTSNNAYPSSAVVPGRPLEERVRWTEINGKTVLMLDFSHLSAQHSLLLIDAFREAMRGKAEASVYMLTDVTGAQYDPTIAAKWKAARSEEDSKVKASAVYGLTGLVGIAIFGFIEAARVLGLGARNIKVCLNADEARSWLAQRL